MKIEKFQISDFVLSEFFTKWLLGLFFFELADCTRRH